MGLRTAARHSSGVILGVQALFWTASAAVFLLRFGASTERLAVAALMVGDGAAFAALALLQARENRLVQWATPLFLGVNAVLCVTDQVGVLDWALLAVNLTGLAASVLVLTGRSASGRGT